MEEFRDCTIFLGPGFRVQGVLYGHGDMEGI